MKKVALIVTICLIVFGLGYIYAAKTIEPDIITKTETLRDTTYLEVDSTQIIQQAQLGYVKYNYEELKKEFGSIYNDTNIVIISRDSTIYNYRDSVLVAKADTSFKEGELRAEYYFPPINYFKFYWGPYPQPIITVTNNIVIKPKWYQRKELWGLTGILIGVTISK